MAAAAPQEEHSDSEHESHQGDDHDDQEPDFVVRSRVPFSSLVYINLAGFCSLNLCFSYITRTKKTKTTEPNFFSKVAVPDLNLNLDRIAAAILVFQAQPGFKIQLSLLNAYQLLLLLSGPTECAFNASTIH